MKKILLASTMLTLVAPASAADLRTKMPVKAPPPVVAPVPVLTWTGCYLGGHVGVGWGRKDFSEPDTQGNFADPGETIGINTGVAFLGGPQVGCNYQFAANWVLGIEGDFSWTHLKGDAVDPFFSGKAAGATAPILFHAETKWIADVTGRLGFAWGPWLPYIKGGAAWARDNYAIDNVQTSFAVSPPCFFGGCNFTGDGTRTGWIIAVGLEWAFWRNWSAKVEFDHYDFGTDRVNFFNAAHGVSIPADVRQRIEAVKFGLNYRFDWGKAAAPVVAKY